jgi:hypothetical protein
MKMLDRLCAIALFILALVDCLLVPKTYTGRIWIFGTCLALMFTAMFNWLRIRNRAAMRSLRIFCITGNLTMLALACSLIASIGKARTLANPQVAFAGILLLIETALSLGKAPDSAPVASGIAGCKGEPRL